ncbi:LysM peptidoglycan-binding domain-containing protein [Primorskyibacter sp. 2E107]|uniref:LysM peptidoglycan-binding domain-containing protein n=1 Tax=Primorskyibacter sp. 2E107 TaxID=3403458 RepID=UPI003AF94E01
MTAIGGLAIVGVAVAAFNGGWFDRAPEVTPESAPEQTALLAPQVESAAPDGLMNPPETDTALTLAPGGGAAPSIRAPSDLSPGADPDRDAGIATASAPEPRASSAAPQIAGNPEAPSFDLVRPDPAGGTMVAGVGAPGAMVTVIVDGARLADTQIASDGTFALFLDLDASERAHVLSLLQTLDGKETPSEEEAIVAPAPVPQTIAAEPEATATPDDARIASAGTAGLSQDGLAAAPGGETMAEPETDLQPEAKVNVETETEAKTETERSAGMTPEAEDPAPAMAKAEPASDPAGLPDEQAVELAAAESDARRGVDGGSPLQAPSDDASAEQGAASAPAEPQTTGTAQTRATAAAQAPAVLVSGPNGIEVMQTAPLAPGAVALDSISYDAAGEVLISGRGDEDGFIRVYLDNAPLTTSRIQADGRWRITLPQVDTGTYTLRVDQIDAGGGVTARVESPFLRESPETLAAAANDGPVTAITVQPGHTLWAIARDRYGEGLDYVKVYEANSDRIRDPDLIYPGQIFDLPQD